MVDFGEDERGKRRGAGGSGRGVFGQYGSAVGDTGAGMVITLVVPGKGKGRRTIGAEWRMMTMPSRWREGKRMCLCQLYPSG